MKLFHTVKVNNNIIILINETACNSYSYKPFIEFSKRASL